MHARSVVLACCHTTPTNQIIMIPVYIFFTIRGDHVSKVSLLLLFYGLVMAIDVFYIAARFFFRTGPDK